MHIHLHPPVHHLHVAGVRCDGAVGSRKDLRGQRGRGAAICERMRTALLVGPRRALLSRAVGIQKLHVLRAPGAATAAQDVGVLDDCGPTSAIRSRHGHEVG